MLLLLVLLLVPLIRTPVIVVTLDSKLVEPLGLVELLRRNCSEAATGGMKVGRFKVEVLEFRVEVSGFRAEGFRVWGSGRRCRLDPLH